MITHEGVDSATSYCFGICAVSLPALIADLTGVLQFMTMIVGFVVICIRAYHDIKTLRKKRNGSSTGS